MKTPTFTNPLSTLALAIIALLATQAAKAANGTWNQNADGNWNISNHWKSGTVASGSGFTADFSTLALTADRTVALTADTTIGNLIFDDVNGAFGWQITGSKFTLAGNSPTINAISTVDIGSQIAGTSGLTKAGSGSLILSNTNTYSGGTTILDGTLKLNNTGSPPVGNVLIDATGILDLNNRNVAISGLSGSGTVNGAVDFVYNLSVGNNDASSAFSGVIETKIGLQKVGNGTLTLTGASTYSGPTTISAGTLSITTIKNGTTASSLGKSSIYAGNLVFDGGTLQYTGATSSTNRNYTITDGKVATIDVSTSDSNLTISGASVATSGGLTKIGNGTLTLTGTNLNTGATNVNAGSLLINGDNSAATGNVTVDSGATLGGTGTVGGATTINSGGIHAPGASPGAIGTQTFSGALTYNSGSTFKWDLSGTSLANPGDTNNQGSYDEVVAGGTLSVIRGAIFEVDLAGLSDNGSFTGSFWDSHRTWSHVFTGAGVTSMDGTLFGFGGSDGNGMTVASDGYVAGEGRFYFTGSTLNWDVGGFTPIPEPGTWMALGCLVGSGLCLRCRRRAAC